MSALLAVLLSPTAVLCSASPLNLVVTVYNGWQEKMTGVAMRHAVLGAGEVGGLVGGALARIGHPVTLIVRPGRQDHYPERLSVESNTLGSFEAPVRVTDRLDEPFDIVWITVKATALEAALETVPEQGLGSGVVVPLLNGIDHVARLCERYGPERVFRGRSESKPSSSRRGKSGSSLLLRTWKLRRASRRKNGGRSCAASCVLPG
jgi:hypothetical protein